MVPHTLGPTTTNPCKPGLARRYIYRCLGLRATAGQATQRYKAHQEKALLRGISGLDTWLASQQVFSSKGSFTNVFCQKFCRLQEGLSLIKDASCVASISQPSTPHIPEYSIV